MLKSIKIFFFNNRRFYNIIHNNNNNNNNTNNNNKLTQTWKNFFCNNIGYIISDIKLNTYNAFNDNNKFNLATFLLKFPFYPYLYVHVKVFGRNYESWLIYMLLSVISVPYIIFNFLTLYDEGKLRKFPCEFFKGVNWPLYLLYILLKEIPHRI